MVGGGREGEMGRGEGVRWKGRWEGREWVVEGRAGRHIGQFKEQVPEFED